MTRGRHNKRTTGRRDGRQHNKQPEQDNERVARLEDDERAVQRKARQQPAGAMRQQEVNAVIG
jgi:hypothetical protein